MQYLTRTMLFQNTSCSMPNLIVDYIKDLPVLGRYAWVETTHRWLIEDVQQMVAQVQKRCSKKKTNTSYLSIVALNIWFYKVTGTGKKMHFTMTPQILYYGEYSFRKQASRSPLPSMVDGKEVFNFFSPFSRYHLCVNVSAYWSPFILKHLSSKIFHTSPVTILSFCLTYASSTFCLMFPFIYVRFRLSFCVDVYGSSILLILRHYHLKYFPFPLNSFPSSSPLAVRKKPLLGQAARQFYWSSN